MVESGCQFKHRASKQFLRWPRLGDLRGRTSMDSEEKYRRASENIAYISAATRTTCTCRVLIIFRCRRCPPPASPASDLGRSVTSHSEVLG